MVVSQTAKLDYKLDYMVVRQETTTQIHLSEIGILIIETTAVSVTASLLIELIKRKVKIIFCDEKRNPCAELVSYYGSHDTSAKVRNQVKWSQDVKEMIWTEIVTEKIDKQRELLNELGKEEANLLAQYIKEIEIGDKTNREGHAAKVYFNALFGMGFTRTADIAINAALNYGYGIILSAVNREVTSNGYITQLGLFHDNMFNQFNLGSDLMEPFRVLVDRTVFKMQPDRFEREEKMSLVDILNQEVRIDGKFNFVNNAIKIYCKSVFEALNQRDVSLIRFYNYEL